MKTVLLSLLLFCASQVTVSGQCDFLRAQDYQSRAINFLKKNQPDSSRLYAEKAAYLFEACDSLASWINLYRKLAAICRDDKQYAEAIALARFAINTCFRETRTEAEHRQLAWAYADIGFNYMKLNNIPELIAYYEKAKAVYIDKIGAEDVACAKYIYSEVGNGYSRQRDYVKAEFYHLRRKDILIRAGEWDAAAGALNDLGVVYLNERNYPKAAAAFSEGLDFKQIGSAKRIQLLYNLGYALIQLGDDENFLDCTRRSEDYIMGAPISSEEKTEAFIWIYDNYISFYRRKSDFPTAEHYFDRKIQAIQEAGTSALRTLALNCIARGNMYLDWQKPEKALAQFSKALQYFLPNFKPPDPYTLPGEELLIAEPNLVDALGGLAKSFAGLHGQKPSDALAEKVMRSYELAADVEALLLQQYILEGSRFSALHEHRWVKAEHLAFTYDRWLKNKQRSDLKETMFTISEKSRAALLWEGLEVTKTFDSENMGAMRTEFKAINQKIEALDQALHKQTEDTPKARIDSLELERLNAEDTRGALLKQTATKLPNAGFAKQRIPIKLADLRQQLDKDQALVEYFIEQNQAYIFVVDPKQKDAAIFKTDWDAEWSAMALTLAEAIYDQNDDVAYIRKARALYEHLIAPVLEYTKARRLIIIPDGVLWKVPFGALLTADVPTSQREEFKKFPYLFLKRCLSYGFSATLQEEMRHKPSGTTGRSLLAFAPAYRKIGGEPGGAKSRNTLDTLLYNIEEAQTVANLYGGTLVQGARASKRRFLDLLSTASVLHIAAHAMADHSDPNFSFIAFSNTGDTLGEPYKLYVHELYNLSMPLDMVVLSACETGTGPVQTGEGVISLARAFANGGARSIVTSLWYIDDEPSRTIMEAFYANLSKGQAKDEALQNAQRQYLERASDLALAHPFYWAAFVPIGNMEPLPDSRWRWGTLLFTGLGLGLLLFVGIFYRRRKRA